MMKKKYKRCLKKCSGVTEGFITGKEHEFWNEHGVNVSNSDNWNKKFPLYYYYSRVKSLTIQFVVRGYTFIYMHTYIFTQSTSNMKEMYIHTYIYCIYVYMCMWISSHSKWPEKYKIYLLRVMIFLKSFCHSFQLLPDFSILTFSGSGTNSLKNFSCILKFQFPEK